MQFLGFSIFEQPYHIAELFIKCDSYHPFTQLKVNINLDTWNNLNVSRANMKLFMPPSIIIINNNVNIFNIYVNYSN